MMRDGTEIYKDYYYPVILLDGVLNVAYKNGAAQAAKVKPRTGVHIRKYINEDNLKILQEIADGKTGQQVIELDGGAGRCLARRNGGMETALIFFDSLNYIKNLDMEAAAEINYIAEKYGEQEQLFAGERADGKIRKIRGHFRRHIANMNAGAPDSEKNYCDIWEFLNSFNKGASPFINGLGYRISFDIENENKMFMHRLNESDFLTLNFIFASYALSKSVFGILDIKFETKMGEAVLMYEFSPGSDFADLNKKLFERGGFENCGNLDLELAALIAKNNNIKLELRTVEIREDKIEGKTQILIYFISSGELSQPVTGANIMSGEDIAARAEIELAFLPAVK
jgi:hypothetical protein